MGIAALVIKIVFALALLLGVAWLGKTAAKANSSEGKGRKGRKSGQDRRKGRKPVPRDRRKEPRRQEEVAEAFLDDLDRP